MCPGVCKDRLADAFDRFGRVPIEKRKIVVPPDHSAFRSAEDPFWSAGGLLHDGRGRVLLIRHVAAAGWGDAWVTPGGRLEEGETTVDGLRREVREEAGFDSLLPGWRARCAGWGRNHPAGEPDRRALRAPPSARPLHAGLASAGDEALQRIWRGLAGALHPRDERRPISFGLAAVEGSGHPLEGNGSGTRFVFGLPGIHQSRPGPRVDPARARCGRIVHLWPRDGLLCAGDDARWAATWSRDPRASRLDSWGQSETRGFGHGDQGNAREWRPFSGESRSRETSAGGLNLAENPVP